MVQKSTVLQGRGSIRSSDFEADRLNTLSGLSLHSDTEIRMIPFWVGQTGIFTVLNPRKHLELNLSLKKRVKQHLMSHSQGRVTSYII